MNIAVPKEIAPGERRVALVPQFAGRLAGRGLQVAVERGAGQAAGFADAAYEEQGARIEESAEALLGSADVVLKVTGPRARDDGRHETELLREGCALIGFLSPLDDHDLVRRLADRRVTAFALELVPRVTRAQSMDALSTMSSIAGYKAVLRAADLLPRWFPMLMTAAGTIPPARVLVLGAGVAGLQAIATARRLGALVEAFDIRPVVQEQVESLGARFVSIDVESEEAQDAGGYASEQTEDAQTRLRAGLAKYVERADVVITTALVPGKPAPRLVDLDTVRRMRPGSVIVDLAAAQGGNVEGSPADGRAEHDGVVVVAPGNLPSELAVHASEMYSRNLTAFLDHLIPGSELVLDLDDELTRAPLVTRGGEVVHPRVREASGLPPLEASPAEPPDAEGSATRPGEGGQEPAPSPTED